MKKLLLFLVCLTLLSGCASYNMKEYMLVADKPIEVYESEDFDGPRYVDIPVGDTIVVLSRLEEADLPYYTDAYYKRKYHFYTRMTHTRVVGRNVLNRKAFKTYRRYGPYYSHFKSLPELPYHASFKSSSNTSEGGTIGGYSGSRTIHTGPRGGKYYINSNGNKTYVKKGSSTSSYRGSSSTSRSKSSSSYGGYRSSSSSYRRK